MNWQAELKGIMYVHGIKNIDIADRLGIGRQYVASIFTGKKNPHDAEEKFRAAVDEIIAEKGERDGER